MQTTLEKLKAEAQFLGIEFHHNSGETKLLQLIKDFKNKSSKKEEKEEVVVVKEEKEEVVVVKEKTKQQRHDELRKSQTKLIRVIVHCNNDNKSEMKGDFFTASNKIVGDYKKFVPFDNEEGFHIPQILLDTMRDKQCLKFRSQKNADGVEIKAPYLAKEYTIEVLPPLTQKELDKLAAAQKARGSIS